MSKGTVMIVGGSSGMGRAGAVAVAKAGYIPFIVARDADKLEAARQEIAREANISADLIRTGQMNATDEDAVADFFSSIKDGEINHIVVTNGPPARANTDTPAERVSKLRQQLDLKFFGQVTPALYAAPKLADGGSITFVSGALSRRPGKGSMALAVSNAALEAVSKALANDFGPRLRVNTVSPGLTDTEIFHSMPKEAREKMFAGFGASVPTGRAGRAEDIGSAFVFLIENTWVDGTVLDVDGGAVIRP